MRVSANESDHGQMFNDKGMHRKPIRKMMAARYPASYLAILLYCAGHGSWGLPSRAVAAINFDSRPTRQCDAPHYHSIGANDPPARSALPPMSTPTKPPIALDRPSPSAALMERLADGASSVLRDDDSMLRQIFFSVLRLVCFPIVRIV